MVVCKSLEPPLIPFHFIMTLAAFSPIFSPFSQERYGFLVKAPHNHSSIKRAPKSRNGLSTHHLFSCLHLNLWKMIKITQLKSNKSFLELFAENLKYLRMV